MTKTKSSCTVLSSRRYRSVKSPLVSFVLTFFVIANSTVTDWLLMLHLQVMPLITSLGSTVNFTATEVLWVDS